MKTKQFRALSAREVVSLGFEGFYTYITKQHRQKVTRDQVRDKYNMYVEVYRIFHGI